MVKMNQIFFAVVGLFIGIAFLLTPTPNGERRSGEQKMPLMLEIYAKEILLINPAKRDPTDFNKYKDFWGSNVRVVFDGKELTLISAGSDKKYGTEDDFIYKEKY